MADINATKRVLKNYMNILFLFQLIKLPITLLLFASITLQVLHDELSLSGHFTVINESKTVLLNRCVESIKRCHINVNDDDVKLPLAYWTPKMHDSTINQIYYFR
jgi:hypothetical protein